MTGHGFTNPSTDNTAWATGSYLLEASILTSSWDWSLVFFQISPRLIINAICSIRTMRVNFDFIINTYY